MEKQKKWQFYLILAVLALTIYNILPTIFYYTKPLNDPIDSTKAQEIAHSLAERTNALEPEAHAWLNSFADLLRVHPTSIKTREEDPGLIEVTFAQPQEAKVFRQLLPRAGALISFIPAQLDLYQGNLASDPNTVLVARKVGIRLSREDVEQAFHFTPKFDSSGKLAPQYREILLDRAAQVAAAFGGESSLTKLFIQVNGANSEQNQDDIILAIAKQVVDADRAFTRGSAVEKRYYQSITQGASNATQLLSGYLAKAEALKSQIAQRLTKAEKDKNAGLDAQALAAAENNKKILESAIHLLKRQQDEIRKAPTSLSYTAAYEELNKGSQGISSSQPLQSFSLQGRNPFVEKLLIDWDQGNIQIVFYDDVQKARVAQETTEVATYVQEKLNQLIINDIAFVSQEADEAILPSQDSFVIQLDALPNSQSYLVFDLNYLARKESESILQQISRAWLPESQDLSNDRFTVRSFEAWKKEAKADQMLGLILYAPGVNGDQPLQGFRPGSLYIIAKGLDAIGEKLQQTPDSPENHAYLNDLGTLSGILRHLGFIGYSGSSFAIAPEFTKDYIFELNDYYANLLKATRENFQVHGSKQFAVLDFSDVEQRILTLNRIDDRIQEDLLKWKEEYDAAHVELTPTNRYLIPKPTSSPFLANLKLNAIKYFRGDDRKILKWGLDLSGGKTVRIGLKDANNRDVTNPDDLKQVVNELYTRVNRMGVSERTIHIENQHIILDFPGSQNMSAADLVKASAMYFHIVNEKFTPGNPALKEAVNQFLQEVWNEAVVTNRKDIDSINEIAWQHLGAETIEGALTRPRSENAQLLYDNGLRLLNPKEKAISSNFNDTLSSVAMMRGEDFADWDGQSHPLLVIFRNYALEGASLTNVHVGYDPTEGNLLSFSVKSSYEGDRSGSPREDFHTWTSQFAEDRILGTVKEQYSQGHGWRMAVILNGTIISKPSLRAALRDGGQISGRFSQREINQLAADLKAGSLSFTPKILSEENVSPELGQEERSKGIIAAGAALLLVIVAMVSYYRFAGVVASCAVLLNILIMWGILQNLDAALTLPGIAGIVLTIGMAVDANVLVFERFREEFQISGRLASAIQAGYRKAFSAIIDSNITTIIAALILTQFDSGPIKSFAVMLIIGIVSSMFTALFVTRYFFAGWVQNPAHKELRMSQIIGKTSFDFLGKSRVALIISACILLAGTFAFIKQRNTFFGMDFTGGYSIIVDLEEKTGAGSYREQTAAALENAGASSNDFQIRELSRPNQLRIQLSTTMEEEGHPFYRMPEQTDAGKLAFSYQQNPRINWLVQTLEASGLTIQPSELAGLNNNWTVMSGQFSDTMRNNAIIALSLAFLSILVYITIRFEFKYAMASVIGLFHDLLMTLSVLAILNMAGLPIQIDLQIIGALMTIIGYSLNDIIIVFDRVREDLKLFRKMKFEDVVNQALNTTLSRTIMTAGTTLLVLLTLVLLGGKALFAFTFVMFLGILIGTTSSLFIAAPSLVFFHRREVEQLAQAKKNA